MNKFSIRGQLGLGVIDLMIVLVVFSLLAALAVPAFNSFVDRSKVTAAIGDIGSISVQIETFCLKNNDQLPDTLVQLDKGIPMDPWGREYRYVKIPSAGSGIRIAGESEPLNTDYDLYSTGGDGFSEGPVDGRVSMDDIVRAKNGAYIGLVEEF